MRLRLRDSSAKATVPWLAWCRQNGNVHLALLQFRVGVFPCLVVSCVGDIIVEITVPRQHMTLGSMDVGLVQFITVKHCVGDIFRFALVVVVFASGQGNSYPGNGRVSCMSSAGVPGRRQRMRKLIFIIGVRLSPCIIHPTSIRTRWRKRLVVVVSLLIIRVGNFVVEICSHAHSHAIFIFSLVYRPILFLTIVFSIRIRVICVWNILIQVPAFVRFAQFLRPCYPFLLLRLQRQPLLQLHLP
jgi:hypothetical protein